MELDRAPRCSVIARGDPEGETAEDIHSECAGRRMRGARLVDGACEKIAGGRSDGAANGDVRQVHGDGRRLLLGRLFIEEIVIAPGARLRARNDARNVRIFVA